VFSGTAPTAPRAIRPPSRGPNRSIFDSDQFDHALCDTTQIRKLCCESFALRGKTLQSNGFNLTIAIRDNQKRDFLQEGT